MQTATLQAGEIHSFYLTRCENKAKLLKVHFQSLDPSLLHGRPGPFVMAIQSADQLLPGQHIIGSL